MKPACEMTVDSPVPSPDPQRCGGIDYPLIATVAFEATTHRCQVASVYDREDIAEFIVRAVNSHDELVSALQSMLKAGAMLNAWGDYGSHPAAEQARLAIARATAS